MTGEKAVFLRLVARLYLLGKQMGHDLSMLKASFGHSLQQ